jgi:DNA-binding CsgD family transcriptional regulator
MHAIAEVPALVAIGKPETALRVSHAAYAEHAQLTPQIAIADAGLHLIHQVYALEDAGALREGFAFATTMYDAIPPNSPPAGSMWIAYLLGRGSLLLGEAATARRWLGEAVARCEAHDFAGPRRLALSLLATAHAWLGDRSGATAAVAELDRVPELPYARPEQEFGRAWALVAAGDVPGARRVLLAAGELAAETGYRGSQAWLLHDVVRLGDAASVVDALEELAGDCEGALVAIYAAHARASSGGRPEPLIEIADRFEALGASLLAGEAASSAAEVYQRRGDSRAASALHARVARLADACEGARTPGLNTAAATVPLSARERDIATLASQGETSKDIATHLFLSVRTVNNHLQRVYTKLGISSRNDLARALADESSLNIASPPPSSSPP